MRRTKQRPLFLVIKEGFITNNNPFEFGSGIVSHHYTTSEIHSSHNGYCHGAWWHSLKSSNVSLVSTTVRHVLHTRRHRETRDLIALVSTTASVILCAAETPGDWNISPPAYREVDDAVGFLLWMPHCSLSQWPRARPCVSLMIIVVPAWALLLYFIKTTIYKIYQNSTTLSFATSYLCHNSQTCMYFINGLYKKYARMITSHPICCPGLKKLWGMHVTPGDTGRLAILSPLVSTTVSVILCAAETPRGWSTTIFALQNSTMHAYTVTRRSDGI